MSVNVTPPDRARTRDEAFADWIAGAEPGWLECRTQNRHLLEGITGRKTDLEVDRKQGVVLATETCPRCSTTVTQVIGLHDGYLQSVYGRPRYEYPEGYTLPPDATEGGVMSREQRAILRHELVAIALERMNGKRR